AAVADQPAGGGHAAAAAAPAAATHRPAAGLAPAGLLTGQWDQWVIWDPLVPLVLFLNFMPSPVRALVFAAAPADRYRAGRTLRALKGLGLIPEEFDPSRPAPGDGPVWLVRAGAWPRAATLTLPPPSATGRSLCALGHVHDNEAWAALQADSG